MSRQEAIKYDDRAQAPPFPFWLFVVAMLLAVLYIGLKVFGYVS